MAMVVRGVHSSVQLRIAVNSRVPEEKYNVVHCNGRNNFRDDSPQRRGRFWQLAPWKKDIHCLRRFHKRVEGGESRRDQGEEGIQKRRFSKC